VDAYLTLYKSLEEREATARPRVSYGRVVLERASVALEPFIHSLVINGVRAHGWLG